MSQPYFVNFRGKSYRIRRNSLILRNKGITNIDEIEGLNNLPFLTVLDLSNNNITEIRGLQNLTNLTNLNLSNNNISEIKGLDNLSNLVYLDLSRNNISEIKGLENLRRLISLNLNYNNITEIKGLDFLTNLMTLNLEANSIQEMKGLENLHRLNALYLSKNNITEVKGIENLRNLKRLDLGKKVPIQHQKAQLLKRKGVLLKEQRYFEKKYLYYLIGFIILAFFVDLMITAIIAGISSEYFDQKLSGEEFLGWYLTLLAPSFLLAPVCYCLGRAYAGY